MAARNRSTEETKAAFDDMSRKVRNKPVIPAKEQDARNIHARSVLTGVAGLTAESAVKKVTEAGLTINKTLGGINEQVIALVEELKKLDEAIRLKTEELAALHGRDVAASAIDVLVAEYDRRKAELHVELERMQKEAAESRARFQAELTADREAAEVARKRSDEAYVYDIQLHRKKEQDAFQEVLRQQSAQERDRKEKLEKDWATREEALALREKELTDLRKQVADFPAVTKREVDAASAIVGSRVKSEWELKFTLAQKDAETAQRVAGMEVSSLKETNVRQAAALQALQAELAEAKRQVQTIAEKALESASGARALAEVQGVIASREYSKNK
ncbi:kinetoplast-associated protein [Corallococcus sp. H22C18031201]|uniref:kinetoplast-associated protein n=1 Tax=Citreicoccus inhibens TaxID=2849499 RepID=UPI000E75A21C|nr:kinetoplast-associated protein [Citreicoccus inhibens]MBU8895150.1 kinetoplast-associated protein [Citreicoccus inhibens]RJS27293.1 kinetoplast-associated protein [Corallococcus sp. H22C18031201]